MKTEMKAILMVSSLFERAKDISAQNATKRIGEALWESADTKKADTRKPTVQRTRQRKLCHRPIQSIQLRRKETF